MSLRVDSKSQNSKKFSIKDICSSYENANEKYKFISHEMMIVEESSFQDIDLSS